MKRAVIVGSEGQDGRLLYDLLARKGYQIVGVGRKVLRTDAPLGLGAVDILDAAQVLRLVSDFKPEEIYYLAAFHHSSEDAPPGEAELFRSSLDIHVQGLVHFLEAVRGQGRGARLFYAASSHVFGQAAAVPLDESAPLRPASVYGITKAAGLWSCRYYRARHEVFASVGMLFNHESPLRGPSFVSKKIVQGALRIKMGLERELVLGDLSAEVDWGWAPDTVEAMRAILAHSEPEDFVVATGEKHSVREFVEAVFAELGLDWRSCVREDSSLLARGGQALVGNSAKLTRLTGWRPRTGFSQMARQMLEAEKAPR